MSNKGGGANGADVIFVLLLVGIVTVVILGEIHISSLYKEVFVDDIESLYSLANSKNCQLDIINTLKLLVDMEYSNKTIRIATDNCDLTIFKRNKVELWVGYKSWVFKFRDQRFVFLDDLETMYGHAVIACNDFTKEKIDEMMQVDDIESYRFQKGSLTDFSNLEGCTFFFSPQFGLARLELSNGQVYYVKLE